MQINSNSKTKVFQTWVEEIIYKIYVEKRKIKNRELLQICGGTAKILNGEINPHFCHEIAETAMNAIINKKYVAEVLTAKVPAELFREIIKPLTEKLPTQTWRSDEQNKWQQFSTPPGIACLLAYLLNLKPEEQVLEPSTGTESLAVWARGLAINTHTNEIEERRRLLLKCLGFDNTFAKFEGNLKLELLKTKVFQNESKT